MILLFVLLGLIGSTFTVFGCMHLWRAYEAHLDERTWKEFTRSLPIISYETPGCSKLHSSQELHVYKRFAAGAGVREIRLYAPFDSTGFCMAALSDVGAVPGLRVLIEQGE